MKTLNIGSYKVPTVDSNHTIHVGGWHVLAPRTGGFNYTLATPWHLIGYHSFHPFGCRCVCKIAYIISMPEFNLCCLASLSYLTLYACMSSLYKKADEEEESLSAQIHQLNNDNKYLLTRQVQIITGVNQK